MLRISAMLLLMSGMLIADATTPECSAIKAKCNAVIDAFKEEVEMKDLAIKKWQSAAVILERQRDYAYKLAEDAAGPRSTVLSIGVGLGAGCVAAGEKVEIRIGCLVLAGLACILGGC